MLSAYPRIPHANCRVGSVTSGWRRICSARRAEHILRHPEVTLPTRQLVWGILGYAESMRGRWPAALAACQEAIRLGNQDPRVRNNADAAAKALGVVPDLPPLPK